MLPRYCEGVATEEERLQVEMWMSESDENRRMAKQIHALFLAKDTVNVMKKVDTEKAVLLSYFYLFYPYLLLLPFTIRQGRIGRLLN